MPNEVDMHALKDGDTVCWYHGRSGQTREGTFRGIGHTTYTVYTRGVLQPPRVMPHALVEFEGRVRKVPQALLRKPATTAEG